MKISIMSCLHNMGLVTIGAAALGATLAQAQGAAANPNNDEITTAKLADNFYELEGRGGTIGVLTGPDGILMVDGESVQETPKILAAIKQFSDQPVRFMVNSHDHFGNTGGNANFAKLGALIISREATRERLRHPHLHPGPGGAPGSPIPPASWPSVTFEGQMHFHMDGENVQLIQVAAAHTDNDAFIYFPHADVIMTGETFSSDQYPYIDPFDGGTVNGMLDAMSTLIGMAGPNTKIIPGHGTIANRQRAIEVRDLILVMHDRVAAMVAQGKTLDEVIASHPTADYDAKFSDSKRTTDRFLNELYAELKAVQ